MNIISAVIILVAVLIFVGTFIFVFSAIVKHVRNISRIAFGTSNIIEGFKNNEAIYENTPKSLAGMDSIIIPKIKKDFPDFNVELAKTYAKQELKKHLNSPKGFLVHDVVFTEYVRHKSTRTIIMQAAFEMFEGERKKQRRCQLNYTYMPTDTETNKELANCPNCGAPAPSTGETVCAYCGSRLFITLDNAWVFTEIIEK